MFKYYETELNRLKHSEYSKQIKVLDGQGDSTKTLDLNLESIPVLMEFLRLEMKRLAEQKSNELYKMFKKGELD